MTIGLYEQFTGGCIYPCCDAQLLYHATCCLLSSHRINRATLLTGIDWERYANRAGDVYIHMRCKYYTSLMNVRFLYGSGFFVSFALLGFSGLSLYLGYSWGNILFMLCIALFVATIESPGLFFFIPQVWCAWILCIVLVLMWMNAILQFSSLRDILLEKCYFSKLIMRGAAYVLISLLCFQQNDPTVSAGVVLLFTGILYIFAHINQTADQRDGVVSTSDHGERLVPSSSFGTF